MADELHMDESGVVVGADVFAVAFERWPWVEHGVEVGSDYCRAAWLPVIGPAAWLLWDSVVRELGRQPRVEWSLAEIARFHGIGCAEVTAALTELGHRGLVVSVAAARWRVRTRCPLRLDGEVDAPRREPAGVGDAGAGRRAQLWASRNRPIASRGAR